MGGLYAQPCSRDQANMLVTKWHRHHKPVHPLHARFQIAASDTAGVIVGVAIVGRPSARMNCDGKTVEVLRVATDGTRNACSFLLGAVRRAAFALGYSRIITYTLPQEGGASLRGAGWVLASDTAGGGSWSRKERRPGMPSRLRVDTHPLGVKCRWEAQRDHGVIPEWPDLNASEDKKQLDMWRRG